MLTDRRVWLVTNEASGSNNQDAIETLGNACGRAGFAVDRVLVFPAEPLPAPAALDRAGVQLVAVFAGDGTVNALIGELSGWGGKVLVLPGGTMNLLYHRLHGEREADEVIALAASGRAAAVRPKVIACDAGMALADCLAGPGTHWYEVREAMRETDVVGVASTAASAIGETLAKPGIVCRQPSGGRPEGYPLVMLTPTDEGMRISGFYAETAGEFLQGSWALLRHRFREGPHDDLGLAEQVTLANTGAEPFGVLLDGERAQSAAEADFRLVPCAVDLLATESDGR
jgi:diacylglycerol kinase family enzyme